MQNGRLNRPVGRLRRPVGRFRRPAQVTPITLALLAVASGDSRHFGIQGNAGHVLSDPGKLPNLQCRLKSRWRSNADGAAVTEANWETDLAYM
jgi:hypothetical protein